MFADTDKKEASSIACTDSTGVSLTYGDLVRFAGEFSEAAGKRDLLFILSENRAGALAGYVAAMSCRIVPLLLSCNTDATLLKNLLEVYRPALLWLPARMAADFRGHQLLTKYDYTLLRTGEKECVMHDGLSLLLTTSGTTGSPKLVRHSYLNIEASARNVAAFFEAGPSDRPAACLPMHYTMGLSVINSHLYAGSEILLMNNNLTDRSFWDFFREKRATSFTGVPYSYEILYKLRFMRMDLPHLGIITQGGGKLNEELFREFAAYAGRTGKKFIATYGQTEGTGRMAYLPAALAEEKTGSIGRAVPEGRLSLVDGDCKEIEETEATGELVYRGPNVTMGYALGRDDLQKGDERNGVLFTGDIARRDADGCYYVIGRKSRFLKLYGNRVSLDETENIIRSVFPVDCHCTGTDELMSVYITDPAIKEAVHELLIARTGLFHKAVEVLVIDKIPRNEAGKVVMSRG